MNKFVLSALALTTAGGLATAGTGSEEWLTLDREIESLASTQAPASTSGVTINGFIRSSYQNSGDITAGPADNDLSGFSLDNARLHVTGTVGDYSLYVQLEGASDYEVPDDGLIPFPLGQGASTGGNVFVLDAYGAWNISDQFKLTLGQFRSPFLGTSQLDENQLLFLDRTISGHLWADRDQGVMLSGQYDMLGWWIAAQNGLDGAGDDMAYSARVAFDAMGTQPKVEGAYGAAEGTNLGISAGYYQDDDSVQDDLAAWNIEAKFIMGPIYLYGSYIDHDDGYGVLLGQAEGPAIMALQGSFMFVPDRWEAAVRWEDLDDDNDTSLLTFGVNYYAVGHDAKWQFNYVTSSSDDSDLEADIFGVGLTVGV
jgi:hypothetical protein